MPIAAFLFGLTWGIVSVFVLLLVRAGARPVPAPEPGSTQLRARFVFRVRSDSGQVHGETRIRPHPKYHLERLTLKTTKTTVLDSADNSQSFRFSEFL
jgi:hypothetical protein